MDEAVDLQLVEPHSHDARILQHVADAFHQFSEQLAEVAQQVEGADR